MKKLIIIVILLLVAAGSYYYFNSNNTQITSESYEYINIEKGNIKKTVSATGKIIPTSTIILSSEISGKIVEIQKDYNEQINKGDVLAIFDQNPFTLNVEETETSVEISESKLKQKKASLEKAKSELNNSISNKTGSESKLDDFSLYVKKLLNNLEDKKVLISDGKSLVIITKFKSYYKYPIDRTPLNYILDKEFLVKKIRDLDQRIVNDELINFTIFKNNNEINIFFDKIKFNLIGWQTIDIYQNLNITYISSIQKNRILKKNLFKLPEKD